MGRLSYRLPEDNAILEKRRANTEGKGRIVGLDHPWKATAFVHNRGVEGAARKKGTWKEYYAMYTNHAITYAAINKVAKMATNVGYDFVPRDQRAEIDQDELPIIQEFFDAQQDFIYQLRRVYKDLQIYGDAYLYIIPDRLRNPRYLKRLHPKTLHVKATRNGMVEAYYQYDPDSLVNKAVEEPVRFEPHEIIHFRMDDPDNDIYGLSPLEALRMAVTADLYAQAFNSAFFRNSGVTGTIIGIKKANRDDMERNRKWLLENYTGPQSAHTPLILEGENITVTSATPTHNEMGFLEGRRFIIMEILAVLDVPPAKLGMMETANRSNAKEQDKTFRTESISALQYIVESGINEQFVRPILGVQKIRWAHGEGDARDAIELMDYYSKGLEKGIFNVNEVRNKLGMSIVEGGEINGIQTPVGFIPLDRLDLFFAMPTPNIDKVPESKRDPAAGEPTPRQRVAAVTGVGPRLAKSADKQEAFAAVLLKLQDALTDDRALRQAYAYAVDASLEAGDEISVAASKLRKACEVADDIFLKQGYIEQASDILFATVMETTNGN